MSTLYDDLLALLDLVESRDCLYGYNKRCEGGFADPEEVCESCTARALYARMVEARDRVT